jgi:hypothetical protein
MSDRDQKIGDIVERDRRGESDKELLEKAARQIRDPWMERDALRHANNHMSSLLKKHNINLGRSAISPKEPKHPPPGTSAIEKRINHISDCGCLRAPVY